ncbi:hypothetical protein DE146DRAFT_406523 [Phaeosphaeria sp. MPI-PUGE-AT-0046c]|nr:hypothetical protein DE146DRAFT_406523 [Phaeosphaeria sp. MPI-PUGE-AT-0046c]
MWGWLHRATPLGKSLWGVCPLSSLVQALCSCSVETHTENICNQGRCHGRVLSRIMGGLPDKRRAALLLWVNVDAWMRPSVCGSRCFGANAPIFFMERMRLYTAHMLHYKCLPTNRPALREVGPLPTTGVWGHTGRFLEIFRSSLDLAAQESPSCPDRVIQSCTVMAFLYSCRCLAQSCNIQLDARSAVQVPIVCLRPVLQLMSAQRLLRSK